LRKKRRKNKKEKDEEEEEWGTKKPIELLSMVKVAW
jgi:hypothetical protein